MTAPRDTQPGQPAPDQADPVIPHRLAAELGRLNAPSGGLSVPPGFDDAVLAMSRARLRPRPVSRLLLRVGTGLAAAAALGLVAWLAWQVGPGGQGGWPSGRGGQSQLALDATGRVDIVDAFVLARRLRDGAAVDPSWDVTWDGEIDQQDVDRLKAMAVQLNAVNGGGT